MAMARRIAACGRDGLGETHGIGRRDEKSRGAFKGEHPRQGGVVGEPWVACTQVIDLGEYLVPLGRDRAPRFANLLAASQAAEHPHAVEMGHIVAGRAGGNRGLGDGIDSERQVMGPLP